MPLRPLRDLASSSSGAGGGDTVSLLWRSGDQGEGGPGLSNLSAPFTKEVRSNDAGSGSLFMLPPVLASNLAVLILAGKAR